ncbi:MULTISPECIES: flagellar protein FliT [Clostridia]|uniref:flagellar protein FliT n=1 Tax=Clostridia TaxID=186801 RepID=UPI000EA09C43|nr:MULTISPECIES: flagellar protein FliT [Clostridia]NBJ69605.1 flagellar protein FliT [Roseburia sp. 1XD42-34]RKI78336.1 flagellar protein FliT [Clostridium sp. 1xD42-85]
MNRLVTLYNITQELYDLLQQETDSKEREALIAKVNNLMEERGKQMDLLFPPYSEAEKATAQEVIRLNQLIEPCMHSLFDALKLEMKQVKKQKQSNRKYANPYETIQARDGMFLDRKK